MLPTEQREDVVSRDHIFQPSSAEKGQRALIPQAAGVVDEMSNRDGSEWLLATVNGLPVDCPVTAREIRRVQFTPVRLTEGCDVTDATHSSTPPRNGSAAARPRSRPGARRVGIASASGRSASLSGATAATSAAPGHRARAFRPPSGT